HSELLIALQLLTPCSTVRSLVMNNNFETAELCQFLIMYILESKINTSTKDFSIDYYNNCYKSTFVPISKLGLSTTVHPLINQFGRIQIRSEIFGSRMTPKYQK
ncbi:35929_t:CDS:2, partial [Racocetra persica]